MAYDPYVDPTSPHLRDAGVRLTSLEEVLRSADVVSLHLPATRETTGLLDAPALASMKPDAFLVNVGRGEVIDEPALVAALEDGHLAGVALDVRSTEPPHLGRLETAPRTLLTPHVAGITTAAQRRIGILLVGEIDAVLDGSAATASVGSHDRPRNRANR